MRLLAIDWFGRRSLVVIVCLTLILTACGVPDPQLASPAATSQSLPAGEEPHGRILFVSDHHIAQWDGSVRTIIDNVNAASPTWAPAGDRFAYVEMHDGYSDLIVARSDGSLLKQLTANGSDAEPFSSDFACSSFWAFDPVWSPSGEQMIWVSDRGGDENYTCPPDDNTRFSDPMYLWFSENLDGDQSILSYLLPAAAGIAYPQENPTISADGQSVAFTARAGDNSEAPVPQIWTLDLEGGQVTTLVAPPDGAYDPAWSPASNNIAYIQRTGTSNDVWIAPTDGGDPYQLTNIGTCVSPAWSPDGKFIAFFRQKDAGFEAWYVEVSDNGGKLSASEPKKLFDAGTIDTTSGMSWTYK
jgi:TolB protein